MLMSFPPPSSLWTSSRAPRRDRTIERILQIAIEEWSHFGFQVIHGNRLVQRGGREHQQAYYRRVGEYWRAGAGIRGLDGRDREEYWSSAFICYVMRSAGVPETEFPSTRRHSEYIHHAIQNVEQRRAGASFHGWRLDEYVPKEGDLLCYSRSGWMTDYDTAKTHTRYAAHGDIVVHRRPPHELWVIGGNVRDSVSLRILYTDYQGFLEPSLSGPQRWFCVIENGLPRR